MQQQNLQRRWNNQQSTSSVHSDTSDTLADGDSDGDINRLCASELNAKALLIAYQQPLMLGEPS